MIGFAGFGGLAVAMAARVEQAVTYGCQVGLTEAESREVIAAWTEHHRSRFAAMRWPDVESSMVARAGGEQWRP